MNKRTISPAALHLHIALRFGHEEADRVCPLAPDASAKPPVADCDPYCMAGSTPCRKCRERAAASAKPAKPYNYRADWTRHPDPSGNNDVHWTCNYCEHRTNYPPKVRHNCPQATTTQPALLAAANERAKMLEESLARVLPSMGWRGTASHPNIYRCEFCGAEHEDCFKIAHTEVCAFRAATDALNKGDTA